jgi:hypothetical protein
MERLLEHLRTLNRPAMEIVVEGGVIFKAPVRLDAVSSIIELHKSQNVGKSLTVFAMEALDGGGFSQRSQPFVIEQTYQMLNTPEPKKEEAVVDAKNNNAQPPAAQSAVSGLRGLGGLGNAEMGAVADMLELMHYKQFVPGLQAANTALHSKLDTMEIDHRRTVADLESQLRQVKEELHAERQKILLYDKQKELDDAVKAATTSKNNLGGLNDPKDPTVLREHLKTLGEVIRELKGGNNTSGDPFASMGEKQKEYMSAALDIAKTRKEEDLVKVILVTNYLIEKGELDAAYQNIMNNMQAAMHGGGEEINNPLVIH